MAGSLNSGNSPVIYPVLLFTAVVGSIQDCGGRENLAFNKPTYQSSTYIAKGQPSGASRAVDGNFITKFYGCDSCTHTKLENNPWWMVDLLQEYYIHRVEITNRLEYGYRFRNVDIESSHDYNPSAGLVNPELCAHVNSQTSGSTVSYDCRSVVLARYIRLTLLAYQMLTMCEVRVFGEAKYPKQSVSDPSAACTKHYSAVSRDHNPSVAPILTERVKSRTACSVECGIRRGCQGFSVTKHGPFDWECALFDCIKKTDSGDHSTTFFIES